MPGSGGGVREMYEMRPAGAGPSSIATSSVRATPPRTSESSAAMVGAKMRCISRPEVPCTLSLYSRCARMWSTASYVTSENG